MGEQNIFILMTVPEKMITLVKNIGFWRFCKKNLNMIQMSVYVHLLLCILNGTPFQGIDRADTIAVCRK